MDEVVLRAMQKWPNVPHVYGWLQLGRRGQWLVKGPNGFERIGNAALNEFIGRNYACDEQGRWYFQNGPQRVYVVLDYAPWVYRLSDAGDALLTHTGLAPRELHSLYLDEQGALLAETECGVGLVLDRDLAAIIERLRDENPSLGDEAALIEQAAGRSGQVSLFGRRVTLASIRSDSVAARFGFVSRPEPRPGEPEC